MSGKDRGLREVVDCQLRQRALREVRALVQH